MAPSGLSAERAARKRLDLFRCRSRDFLIDRRARVIFMWTED